MKNNEYDDSEIIDSIEKALDDADFFKRLHPPKQKKTVIMVTPGEKSSFFIETGGECKITGCDSIEWDNSDNTSLIEIIDEAKTVLEENMLKERFCPDPPLIMGPNSQAALEYSLKNHGNLLMPPSKRKHKKKNWEDPLRKFRKKRGKRG